MPLVPLVPLVLSLLVVPARLDRVEVRTAQRVVVITWDGCDELLARLLTPDPVRRGRVAVVPELRREIVRGFDAVGATRPVDLTPGQRDELRAVLDVWDGLPDGLRDLHAALAGETCADTEESGGEP
jgi:hypothetical protein